MILDLINGLRVAQRKHSCFPPSSHRFKSRLRQDFFLWEYFSSLLSLSVLRPNPSSAKQWISQMQLVVMYHKKLSWWKNNFIFPNHLWFVIEQLWKVFALPVADWCFCNQKIKIRLSLENWKSDQNHLNFFEGKLVNSNLNFDWIVFNVCSLPTTEQLFQIQPKCCPSRPAFWHWF